MIRTSLISRILGIPLILLIVSGCGILDTSSGRPKEVRLVLDQSTSTSMEVSISLNFLVAADQAISFEDLSVDTVSVPFDQVYDVRSYRRLYVQVKNLQEESATFRMKMTIDGRNWLNTEKVLEPGEAHQVVYRYQEPALY